MHVNDTYVAKRAGNSALPYMGARTLSDELFHRSHNMLFLPVFQSLWNTYINEIHYNGNVHDV